MVNFVFSLFFLLMLSENGISTNVVQKRRRVASSRRRVRARATFPDSTRYVNAENVFEISFFFSSSDFGDFLMYLSAMFKSYTHTYIYTETEYPALLVMHFMKLQEETRYFFPRRATLKRGKALVRQERVTWNR